MLSSVNLIDVINLLFQSTIAAGFLIFIYKRFYGMDDVSLKKIDRKYEEFDKNKTVIASLSDRSINSLLKLTAYEILFKKDVSKIDLDALDIIISMKNPKKALEIYEKCSSFLKIEDKKFKKKGKKPKYKLWSFVYWVIGIVIIFSIMILPSIFMPYLNMVTSLIYKFIIIELLVLCFCIPFFCMAAYSLNRISIKTELEWITKDSSYLLTRE